MKKFYLLIVLSFIFTGFVYSQTDVGPDTKFNVPGNWSITPTERNAVVPKTTESPIPQDLMNQYLEAKRTNDNDAKGRLGQEMDKYLNVYPTINNGEVQMMRPEPTPMELDWGIGDVPVHIGNVASTGGWRQMDMKMGEDGNLYIAINRANVSGYTGYITVYRSTNGGRNWIWVSGTVTTTHYFGQITMLVEKRHATNNDSTRIILYYTVSATSNQNDASLYYATFLRSGATGSWYSGQVATPTAGNKLQYPSACSDGQYYDTPTYMHLIVDEVTNAGVYVKLWHFRTTSWCVTHTGASFAATTAWQDLYPSAAFSREVTISSDSIYVAVERRFTAPVEWALRLLVIPEVPSSVAVTNYLAYTAGKKYEKPCITIQQEYASTPRKILVTSTKDMIPGKTAVYHTSTNGGSSWVIDQALGYTWQQCDFTWCNSDSTTAGGGYFIAGYVDLNGDSVSVRRGVIGSMGTVLYKRNAHASTGTLPPVVAIYKESGNKYSAFAYAGLGPTNVYFNQENLPAVGITPIGNKVPDKFELSQNYPNPFNPNTSINFKIPSSEYVILKVYDLLGREAATLVNENLKAGEYNINFNATNLTSGLYFYKLSAGSISDVKKMMVVK